MDIYAFLETLVHYRQVGEQLVLHTGQVGVADYLTRGRVVKTLLDYATEQVLLLLYSCHCLQLLQVLFVKFLLVLLKLRAHQLTSSTKN